MRVVSLKIKIITKEPEELFVQQLKGKDAVKVHIYQWMPLSLVSLRDFNSPSLIA